MTKQMPAVANNTLRSIVWKAGYYVACDSPTEGRWYIGHRDRDGYRFYGYGFATQRAALEFAAQHVLLTNSATDAT